MLEQLQAHLGKKIALELTNGRILSGTVISVEQQFVRFGTDDGIGTIPVNAVQIIWEPAKRSLTEENMEEIAGKLRESVKTEIACTGLNFNCTQQYICRPPDYCTGAFSCPFSYVPFQGGSQCPVTFGCTGAQFYGFVGPGTSAAGQAGQGDIQSEIACTGFPAFNCRQQYICRPPDICSFSFACPGSYVPGAPQGGGTCPRFFCGPFTFQQPCSPFVFQQPCGPFVFQQPCSPFVFQQPCSPFVFQQPCSPFVFGGSQCGVPGGFICPGQQFIGIVGSPTGPGLSPMEFSVKNEDPGKDDKVTKE